MIQSLATDRLKDCFWLGARAVPPVPIEALPILPGDRVCPGSLLRINGFTTLDRPQFGYAFFLDLARPDNTESLKAAAQAEMLLVGPAANSIPYEGPCIQAVNVRATAAAILMALFPKHVVAPKEAIDTTALVDPTAAISVGVVIGRGAVIGPRTVILPNVTIGPNVRIGAHCIIKSGTVIGQAGFGFYRSDDGSPEHLPHVGGVVIGNRVELGALNTVASGTIHPTVLGDQVKTDDHVHIAHNCVISAATLIAACAELSGSVEVGEHVWIGPNATARDGISLGDRSFVAIGSVVTKSVPADCRVFGSPARPIGHREAGS